MNGMKRFLLKTVCLFSPLGGFFAQSSLPLLNETNIWSCYGDYFFINVKYHLGSDTLINGKSWKKVYAHGSTIPFNYDSAQAIYKSALREENGVVSVIEKGFIAEHILYNFNKTLGDTIRFYKPIGDFNQGVLPYYVVGKIYKIDVINVNGVSRKRWFIHDPNMINQLPPQALSGLDSQADIWIEGVGGKTGLFSRMPEWGVVGPQPYLLTCLEQNGNIVYSNNLGYDANQEDPCFINPPEGSGENDSLILKFNHLAFSENGFNVFPNPAQDNISISNSMNNQFEFMIKDTKGAIAIRGISEAYSNETKVNLSKLSQGFYYLQVQTNSQIRIYKIQKL
jgi:hypothetical protein